MSKVQRNLDGVYFRVQREGGWRNVCYSDMTPDERKEVIYDRMDDRPLSEQVSMSAPESSSATSTLW